MRSMKETIYIYGRHAIIAALSNKPHCVETIYTTERSDTDEDFQKALKSGSSQNPKIQTKIFDRNHLPQDLLLEIESFGTHQNLVARIMLDRLVKDGKEFLKNFEVRSDSVFLILGEIHDIQNIGSILRSANAFGVDGVFIPEHNQAPITGQVVKISAGGAFSVPLLSIGNINQTIEVLKEKRFWIYGLDGSAKNTIYTEEKYTEASAFIIGNEAEGLREKTKEHCDILIRIPISNRCESLNAAVSTAVVLGEFRRQNHV